MKILFFDNFTCSILLFVGITLGLCLLIKLLSIKIIINKLKQFVDSDEIGEDHEK